MSVMIWVENFIGGEPLILDVGPNFYEIPPPTWEDGGPSPPGCLCLQLDPEHYMAESHQPTGSGQTNLTNDPAYDGFPSWGP